MLLAIYIIYSFHQNITVFLHIMTRETGRSPKNPRRKKLSARFNMNILLVILFVCFHSKHITCSSTHLSIAYLSSSQDDLPVQAEQETLNAIQMALDDTAYLLKPMPKMSLSILEKKIEINESIPVILDEVIQSGAMTVFSHSELCDQTISVLKSRNRLAISNVCHMFRNDYRVGSLGPNVCIRLSLLLLYIQVCGDERLSNKRLYPTFLRTRPSDSQV